MIETQEFKMKVNIYSLYVIKLSKWFNLVMPTIVLFYQNTGMSMQDILVLKSIYSLAIVMFEIPSGYCADVLGRKKTLFMGSILGALGFVIYSVNHVYAGFVLAEIILGLGQGFISGADSAMLYDSLKAADRTALYLKHEGRITAVGNFAEALAGIAGGLLATITLRTPFYFQALVAAAAIPAALMLREPGLGAAQTHRKNFRNLRLSVRHAFSQNPILPWAILISSVTGTATLTFAWFVQPWFKAAGLPLALYGAMWTVLNLTTGAVGLFAHRVENFLGRKKSLVFVVVFISAGFFLAGSLIRLHAMGVLFIFYAARGIATPVLKDYIHRYCESEIRATILSFRNFIIRINFAVAGPLLGFAADRFSLNGALWAAGGIYLLIGGICIIMLLGRRHSRGRNLFHPENHD